MRSHRTELIVITLLSLSGSGCSSSDASTGTDAKGSGGAATNAGGAATNGGAPSGGAGGNAESSSGGASAGGATGTAGSGAGASATDGGAGGATTGVDGGAVATIAGRHPGDVGIETDPDVVFVENFEEASVTDVTARYDDFKNAAGMALDADVPAKSAGKASIRFTASGTGQNATDLYKSLTPGYDELFVRYYAKYQSGAEWHHTGVWIGGYNPPTPYPNPQAGLKPNGDDRFSVSFEPMETAASPRMDFYNYWMTMHSWMDVPMGSTAYYGNSLIHQNAVRAPDAWMCVEIHVTLNPDGASSAGAELGLWVDDRSIDQFTDSSPLGYWTKDKFCPENADSAECTNYPPPAGTALIPLDLRYRSTTALKLNVFWPQNYITSGPDGSVWYDDMVVAKARIGCIR